MAIRPKHLALTRFQNTTLDREVSESEENSEVRELETNYGDDLDAMRPLDANAMRLYAHARGSFTQ